jgi:hypothetical protein
MSNVQFNPKHKEVIDTFLLDIPFVKPGKMYGHPAYYIGGKLFASLFMEGVCVKVPESLKTKLLEKEEIVPFEPMGRKMREWILINRKKSEDYLQDKDIFNASAEYVASLTNIDLKVKK